MVCGGKGGQLFWNRSDGNGTEPREDADTVVKPHTDTHTNATLSPTHTHEHTRRKAFEMKLLGCRPVLMR